MTGLNATVCRICSAPKEPHHFCCAECWKLPREMRGMFAVQKINAFRGCENTMRKKQTKTERLAARQKAPQESADQIKKREWLAIRKKAGRRIDPETAEVLWSYEYTLDPYGLEPELPEEYRQVGREYFARSPGSNIWVWFGDLPAATQDALWEKHKSSLAFPAGLPPIEDDGSAVSRRDGDGSYVVEITESMSQRAAKWAEEKRAELITKGYIRYAENAEQ